MDQLKLDAQEKLTSVKNATLEAIHVVPSPDDLYMIPSSQLLAGDFRVQISIDRHLKTPIQRAAKASIFGGWPSSS